MKNHLSILWPPIILTILLVAQNSAFDYWNGLDMTWQLRSALATLALGVLLFGASIFMSYIWRYIYLLMIVILVSVLFVSQYLFFAYSGGFLQASALRYIGQANSLGGAILAFWSPHLVFFVLGIPIVALAYILADKEKSARILFLGKAKFIIPLIVLCFPTVAYGYVVIRETQDGVDIKSFYDGPFDVKDFVAKIGVLNYYAQDLLRVAMTSTVVTEEDRDMVSDYLVQHAKMLNSPNTHFGVAKGRNVIFLQVESLENFTINRTIDDQQITPNLNALIPQSLYFSHYYYQPGPGTTADAEFSVTNSLYPLANAVAFFAAPHDNYDAFPDLMKDNGYDTAAFHGDVPSFWNRNNIYPQLGYTHIFTNQDFSVSRRVNLGLSVSESIGDEEFLDQVADRLKTLEQPFAATAITLSSHTPFELPPDLQTLTITDPDGLSDYQIRYLQAVHYADRSIGEFLDKLKASGLYDNSLIVIYGDHKSFISTQQDDALAHFLGLPNFTELSYLNNSQVPLFILAPGLNLTGVQSQPASHLDLYPTLANLLGIKVPPTVLGQDVLTTRNPIVTQRQGNGIADIITPNLTYLAASDGLFQHGQCLDAHGQTVPIAKCQLIYSQQRQVLHVSDLMVKGNVFLQDEPGK